MRNSLLHYGGIIVALFGLFLAVGPYAGLNGAFGITLSDYTGQVIAGIILIIVGGLMFFFIDE